MGAKPDDFAILYRTNSSGRAILNVCTSQPFRTRLNKASGRLQQEDRPADAGLSLLKPNQDDAEAVKQILPALFLKQSALNTLKALSITEDCTMVQALEN
ncbi:hypothetical protein PO124_28515 [Bacillus licheniformis]|nr:hypothetical protein [Bacillus licheniformis]